MNDKLSHPTVPTILLVDDNQTNLHVLIRFLADTGYEIMVARSSEQMFEQLGFQLPHLILLDVMLPGMDGFQACHLLKERAETADIPVIFMTALSDLTNKIRGFDAGGVDYITKPFQQQEVLARVQTHLRVHQLTHELVEANHDLENRVRQRTLEIQQAYEATIEGWARALELRDQETRGHSDRVVRLTLDLALLVGVPESDLPHIRRGAMLHDIGKISIPDSILFKPQELTGPEWETMRRHPLHAYELLRDIAYLKPAITIPWCHHEHWDGSGYPQGLAGEDIPLAARIFTLVDVWDALSNDRPYHRAWAPGAIADYLLRESGKLFDPRIVPVFLRMMRDNGHLPGLVSPSAGE